ncbi:MAG: hypothetical protein ACX94D_14175 [Henriciella sp.]|jgi:hypothetical protein
MKTNSILRGTAGLQSFIPSVSRNVQEITPQNGITVSVSEEDLVASKPRLLAQRSARHARRLSH